METLKDLLTEQLRDIYSAERQLVDALPKAAEASVTAELKAALEGHLYETKNQLKRLDRISQHLGVRFDTETCEAMQGLISEAAEIVDEEYEFDELKEAMIVAICQKIEHYEIAAYGNVLAISEYLEMDEVSSLLQTSLAEEKNADRSLTAVCEEHIFPACDQEYSAHAVMDNESIRTRS